MQTVRTSNQAITANQSLLVVKTLLQAGLGCITYLRGLLPADNFTNSSLIASKDTSLVFYPSDTGETSETGSKRDRNGLKVMTITRGFTEEADKLLNFMEYGIYEALEKQYLRKFIFAVYLDDKDPNNIIEAYTFNFNYHTIPGSETTIPIMSLGDDLLNMSLGEARQPVDPAAEAAKKGNAPTFGEVKKSLRVLVKRLISATTSMEHLPYHRYASFKLFYNDHTPEDYEPPNFRPGDFEKDKWTFATHNGDEAPEKISLGKLETPWHGVDVAIASVASYLPTVPAKDPNAHTRHQFGGTSDAPLTLTPVQEANVRRQEIEILRSDAEERGVAWPAEGEGNDPDAEGEIDPDYVNGNHAVNSSSVFDVPLGISNVNRGIMPTPREDLVSGEEEARFGGATESVPSRVGQMRSKKDLVQLDQTQQLDFTQEADPILNVGGPSAIESFDIPRIDTRRPTANSLPPSDPFITQTTATNQDEIDTQELKDMVIDTMGMPPEAQDTEMLDMETQLTTMVPGDKPDSIDSFGTIDGMEEDILTPRPTSITPAHPDEVVDKGLDCACGVSIEDDQCFCDAGCGRWYHIWCLGYHSIKDRRMRSKLTCFDCRIRSDECWDLIVHDLYPQIVSKYNLLALFRRAIKVAEKNEPENASSFAKLMGCEIGLASQLFDRLESEGFIAAETTVMDESSLLAAHSHATKSHKAKNKQRKKIQKPRFVFVRSSKKTAAYLDYFNPKIEVESRLVGLSEMMEKVKARKEPAVDFSGPSSPSPIQAVVQGHLAVNNLCDASISVLATSSPQAHAESQTQDETQHWPLPSPAKSTSISLKRKAAAYTNSADLRKKIKISLAPAVDLGE